MSVAVGNYSREAVTTKNLVSNANYAFHPVRVASLQRILWIALGLLLCIPTCAIMPTIFFSVFFQRSEYLNRKKMYKLIKKFPYLLREHFKTNVGYVWPIDLVTQICWIKDGVFCASSIEDPDDEIIFCTYLADRLQRHYDREIKKLLKASLPKKSKKASTEIYTE